MCGRSIIAASGSLLALAIQCIFQHNNNQLISCSQFDVSVLSFCSGQLPTHWRLTIWLWLRPQSWLQSWTCVTFLPQLRFRELSATRLLPQTAPRNWIVPWHRIQLLSACSPIDTTHAGTERGPDIPGSFLKHVIRTAMLFYFDCRWKRPGCDTVF